MTKLMTDPPLYFDTDCLSAFLWVKNESILTQLYPGRVIIPKQVYDELGGVPHLQGRIDTLLGRSEVELLKIEAGTAAAELYAELTGNPRPVCRDFRQCPPGRGPVPHQHRAGRQTSRRAHERALRQPRV